MKTTQEQNLAIAKQLLQEVEKLCFRTDGESILNSLYNFEKQEKEKLVRIEALASTGVRVENPICEADILKRVYISEAWNKVSQINNTITDVIGLIEEIEGLT